jgi:hypothetical protein
MVAILKRIWNFADSLDIFVALATLTVIVAYLYSSGQLDGMFEWQAVAGVVDKATTAGGELALALEAARAQGATVIAAGLALVRTGWMSMVKGWVGWMSTAMGWVDMMAWTVNPSNWGLDADVEDAQGAPPDFLGLL